jgi:cytochrome c oxidase assembly protein subunit 11
MNVADPIHSKRNRSLTWRLAVVAIAMFGFGYLLVPFYYLMCEIAGVGGRTADAVAAAPTTVDSSRRVTVEFVASVNQYAPWEFRPETAVLDVEPGRLYDVKFLARNLTSRHITGQAVPSVAPGQSARFLKKTECFCFRSQEFAPAESRDLTVKFYLDPALPRYVDRMTLSYTMFVKPREDENPDQTKASGAAISKARFRG